MEDFLYILLLVVWVVFSIYKKTSKKKKSAAVRPLQKDEGHAPAQPKPRSIFEQILLGDEPTPTPFEDQEQSDDMQFIENFEDQDIIQSKKTELSDAEISEKYDFDPSKEGESSNEVYNETVDHEDENETTKGINFDLRQAVIFSEILKRPYAN